MSRLIKASDCGIPLSFPLGVDTQHSGLTLVLSVTFLLTLPSGHQATINADPTPS